MKLHATRFAYVGAILASFLFLILFTTSAFAAQELWTQQTAGFDPSLTTGAATHAYPIAVPPGRNGIEPSLSLDYASTNRDQASEVGYGWRLPMNRITRRPIEGVNSMYDDGGFQLELNGSVIELQQITSTSGEYGTYGADIEGEFYQVTFDSVTDDWTVESRYGQVYLFESDTASNMVDPSDSSRVFAWYLTEMSDLQDNNATYTYYKDGQRVYPKTINYTGNGTETGQFTVRFEPFATGTPTVRDDVSTSGRAGFLVETRYLIDRIEVDVAGETHPVLEYAFAYGDGSNSTRSLLTSITKYGRDSSGTQISLPATEFTYSVSDNNWTQDATYTLPDWGTNDGHVAFGDFSGDGLVDEMLLRELVSSWDKQIYEAEIDGMVDATSDWTLPDFVFDDAHSIVADLNGDGRSDFARSVWQSGPQTWDKGIFLNAGDETFTDESSNWTIPDVDFGSADAKIADFNGDGLIDVLFQENCSTTCTTTVYENNGTSGWFDQSSSYTVPNVEGSAWLATDVNGDGLVDFWRHQRNGSTFIKQLYINEGDGTWSDETSSWTLPDDDRSRVIDINGDGLVDMYRITENGSGYKAYLNTGSGWEYDSTATDSAGGYGGGRRFYDLNGDGLVDSAYVACSGTCTQAVYIHDGDLPDLLSEVTTSDGGTISYTYTSSAEYEDSSGDPLNPDLPFVIPTVSSIEKDDDLGNSWTTDYEYQLGKFASTDPFDGRFAGFGVSVESYEDGSSKKTYFHQGNPEDGLEKGEYQDHYDKIGRPYKVEIYDTNDDILQRTMTGWGRNDLLNDRAFVFPFRETVMHFNDDGSRRDTATSWLYYDNGTLKYEAELGEVTAGAWGGYTDTGDDKRTTWHYYVTSTGGHYLDGVEYFTKIRNQQNVDVYKQARFFDNQPWGEATDGLVTASRQYIDATNHRTTNYWYNAYGNVTKERNPNLHNTHYTYDTKQMYPTVVKDHELNATDVETDLATGVTTRTEDPNGTIGETDVDTFGRVEEERASSHANETTLETLKTYSYGTAPASRTVTTHIDGTTTTQSAEYMDGFGRLVQTRVENDASGFSVTDTAYDDAGNVTRVSLPYDDTTIGYEAPNLTKPDIDTTYDRLGRVLTVVDGAGTVSRSYEDWEETVTDEEGNVKVYAHDAHGNLVRVDEHDGVSVYETTYTRDALDRLTKIEDADGNLRDFTYDFLGRKLTMTDLYDPAETNIREWSYTYDSADNLTEMEDPAGNTVTYTYDTLERMLTEDADSTTGTDVTYTYDTATNGIGRVDSVTRGDVETEYTYNERGSVDDETRTIGTDVFTTSYTYDRQGREATRTYPDNSVLTTTYNDAGLPETLKLDSTTIVSSVAYTPQGTPGTITFGNGTTTTNTYDLTERGRLTSRVTTKGLTTLQDLSYDYDGTGNVLEIIDDSGSATDKTSTYVYDDLNRLTSFSTTGLSGGDVSRSYGYDKLGNMTSHPVHGTLTYGGNTNANPHALDGDGTNTWTYSANGNVTGDGSQTYSWSYRNEMVISNDGSTDYLYTYDHTGDRVAKQHGSDDPTFYIGDYVYDEDADEHEIHVALGATPVFERKTDSVGDEDTWMHANHLDSVAVMTDDAGAEAARTDYWPFGDIRYESGTDENRFDFTNKERDESGLNYFEARYLDTDLGRFRSQDAWAGDYMDPQSFNKYAYARNNPAKYVDPDGNQFYIPTYSPRVGGGLRLFMPKPQLTPAQRNADRIATSLMPIVGDVQDISEVASGRDFYTGVELTSTEKAVTRAAAFVPIVSGRVVREGLSWAAKRRAAWKEFAQDPSAIERYGQEGVDRMQQGMGPIGDDGYTMELHHVEPRSLGGSDDISNLEPMTRTEHRLGENYKKNHPDIE